MVRGGVTYRFLHDHLGSVRIVVNTATGAVAQMIGYDEFGTVLSDTAPGFQPFGFAGGLYDTDTKLVRFGARDYNPVSGRWMTKDPIGFNGAETNLYAYAFGDPINSIDPDGRYAGVDDAAFLIGGAIVGLAARGIADLWAGEMSGWEDYTAAFVGGALGGWALEYSGPVGAGLAGGAATNMTRQLLRNLSGKQCGYWIVSFGAETALGGAFGLVNLCGAGFKRVRIRRIRLGCILGLSLSSRRGQAG